MTKARTAVGAAQPKPGVSRPRSARSVPPPPTPEPAADPYRALLEQMADGFVAFDREFRYLYVNGRAGELLGRSPDELVGNGYYDLYPEAVGTPFERAYARAMTERIPIVIEDYFAPWDRWFENRISPTPDGICILFSEITERKRAEQVVGLQADLLSSVPEAVVATDENLKVIYWNTSAANLLGWSSTEAIGRSISDVVEAWSETERSGIIDAVRTTGSWHGEAPRRRRDGSWFDANIHLAGRRSPDGRFLGLIGVIENVTQRNVEFRRSRFQAQLLNGAHDAIIVFSPDRRIQLWNRGAEELFGWTAAEAIGQTTEILGFLIVAEQRAEAAETLARGERWREEITYHHRDGTASVGDAVVAPAIGEQGEPIFYSVVRDVTERVRLQGEAEAARRSLEALHEVELTIIETSDFGTVAAAAARAVRALIGCDLAAIGRLDLSTGDLVVSAVDGDSAVMVSGLRVEAGRETLDALRAGEAVYISDLAVPATGNASAAALSAEGWGAVLNAPLQVETELVGNITMLWRSAPSSVHDVQAILTDIGNCVAIGLRQMHLQAEIAEHVAELETRVEARTAELADINAELDAFSATVAHDLRAPLRSMHGFAQALVEDEGENLSDRGRDYTDRIRGAAHRMEALIADLLEYSRLSRSRLNLRDISLDSALQSALGQVSGAIEERGAEIDKRAPLGHARADRPALVQALANLLGNAVKFVPPDRTPKVTVFAEARDGRRRLWVEDNGIGIESRHRERVFLPFERLHGVESYPGTGVGLAVVQRILGRMDGECGFESEPGLGSRFWIELADTGPA